MFEDVVSLATSIEPNHVQVTRSAVLIHHLSVSRPAVVAYLSSLPQEKAALALTHLLEVGVVELARRRSHAS